MIQQITDIDQIDDSQPFVVVLESKLYPAQLMIEGVDSELLHFQYPQFISDYNVLIETGLWDEFVKQLETDGYRIYILPTANGVLEKHREWSQPLVVEGLKLASIDGREPGLFAYQQYGLRKGLDSPKNFMFANHDTGTGKGILTSALIQELFNRDQIDVAYVFTFRKMKTNLTRLINSTTLMEARNIEGTKAKRRKEFDKRDAQVYVMNYEKANFDFDILSGRIQGQRVLFVFDEVQKILIHDKKNKPNKATYGINMLLTQAGDDAHVWPMSATAVNADPHRYYNLFDKMRGANPLGKITAFRQKYTSRIIRKQTHFGMEIEYQWDPKKVREIRHIVAPYTHSVRKNDPGVREYFKTPKFEPVFIELSEEDRKLYDLILEIANAEPEDMWGQYYRVLQYICNTPESLKHSESEIAQTIAEEFPDLSSKTSSKMETLIEMVEQIRDQGDKVVVFTKYTNLSLFLIAEQFRQAGINFVEHYGTGMTEAEAQKAQDDFKADPGITVFLSSDAGSHGLSFQEARYVISYECPYSFDLLKQRNDRIDRADSYLDGLTFYVFVTEDTVETRIWDIMNARKEMNSEIQGTSEDLERPEEENHKFLLFG